MAPEAITSQQLGEHMDVFSLPIAHYFLDNRCGKPLRAGRKASKRHGLGRQLRPRWRRRRASGADPISTCPSVTARYESVRRFFWNSSTRSRTGSPSGKGHHRQPARSSGRRQAGWRVRGAWPAGSGSSGTGDAGRKDGAEVVLKLAARRTTTTASAKRRRDSGNFATRTCLRFSAM